MKFRFSLTVLLIGLSFPARAEVLGTIETEQDDGSLSVIEILDEPQVSLNAMALTPSQSTSRKATFPCPLEKDAGSCSDRQK